VLASPITAPFAGKAGAAEITDKPMATVARAVKIMLRMRVSSEFLQAMFAPP